MWNNECHELRKQLFFQGGGEYLGVRSWKMSWSAQLVDGVMVVIFEQLVKNIVPSQSHQDSVAIRLSLLGDDI